MCYFKYALFYHAYTFFSFRGLFSKFSWLLVILNFFGFLKFFLSLVQYLKLHKIIIGRKLHNHDDIAIFIIIAHACQVELMK